MKPFWESGTLYVTDLESGGVEVAEDWSVHIPYLAGWPCRLDDLTGYQNFEGVITIKRGFRCDGGSFIAVDTRNKTFGFAEPGFVLHDLGYRFGKRGDVPQSWRVKYDRAMRDLHLQHGVPWLRAQWLYLGVRIGAASHFAQQPDKEKIVRAAS